MRKRVEETLDLLGLAELRNRALSELSGGELQHAAMGATLAPHPNVLVLDEPTSTLDPTGAEEVLAAVKRLVHDLGITVVVAEHRLERVVQYADLVAHVHADGTVQLGEPTMVLSAADVAPPIVELARRARWEPVPLRYTTREGSPGRCRITGDSRHQRHARHGTAPRVQRHDRSRRFESVELAQMVALMGRDAGQVVVVVGTAGIGSSRPTPGAST